MLGSEKPRCKLEREAVALSDASARSDFLVRRTAGARKVAIITEELVIYLDEAMVTELSRAFTACASVHTWILDFNSPRIVAEMSRSMSHLLGNAPFKFGPSNGLAFFENLG